MAEQSTKGAIKEDQLTEAQKNKQIEAIEDMIMKGIPLKQSLNISADILEFMYGEGHRLYMIRKYPDAIRYFQMLYMLDPMDARFAFGVAASYHMLKDYTQAIAWYLTLTLVDQQSPLPYYHMSDCFLKQGERAVALELLKKVLLKIGNNGAFDQLKERVNRMIQPLEKEVKKV